MDTIEIRAERQGKSTDSCCNETFAHNTEDETVCKQMHKLVRGPHGRQITSKRAWKGHVIHLKCGTPALSLLLKRAGEAQHFKFGTYGKYRLYWPIHGAS